MLIGILQCDSVNTNLQPEFGDYPGMHSRLLMSAGGGDNLQFRTYDLTAGQFPESVEACDAWLFTGSKWSVYDADDWIIRAHDFVRELHAEQCPTLGICFGHQLICRALGGQVEKSGAGWGVGVHVARILEQRPWMSPPRDTLSLLVSHQDQVVVAPEGAMLLATHPFCPNDMFEIDGHMLTLQGHPEFPKGYSRAIMDMRHETIGESTYQEGITSLEQSVDADIAAHWMLDFLQRAIEKKRSRSP